MDSHDLKPTSAITESMLRIGHALQIAQDQLDTLPWYRIGRKTYLEGVVSALGLCLEGMHQMMHKYENVRGEFN